MSKLLQHLPEFYKDIREFRELSNTVTIEYDSLSSVLEKVENDQFVITSSETAIARREKDYEIVPDLSIETLDFRKRRLLARMQENVPYTVGYLRDLLDSLLGESTTQIELSTLLFELEVIVFVENASFYLEIGRLLERIVPLNIFYKIITRIQSNLFFASSFTSGEEVTVYPWRQTFLESSGHLHLGTAMQSFDESTIYPQPKTSIETIGFMNLGTTLYAFDESTIYPEEGE